MGPETSAGAGHEQAPAELRPLQTAGTQQHMWHAARRLEGGPTPYGPTLGTAKAWGCTESASRADWTLGYSACLLGCQPHLLSPLLLLGCGLLKVQAICCHKEHGPCWHSAQMTPELPVLCAHEEVASIVCACRVAFCVTWDAPGVHCIKVTVGLYVTAQACGRPDGNAPMLWTGECRGLLQACCTACWATREGTHRTQAAAAPHLAY